VVLAAEPGDPFDDAELYRVGHLVRTFGAGNEIEVGIVDGHGWMPVIDRLERLGFHDIVLVPAGFHGGGGLPHGTDGAATSRFYGPIMSDQVVGKVVQQRLDAALHDLAHGRTGIAAGLAADHGHGYAHSHDIGGNHHDHDHHDHGHHEHDHDQSTFIHAH